MIRPYKDSDRDDLIVVLRSNMPKYFHPVEQKDFENYLEEHKNTYFVYILKNKIIGGCGYYIEDNIGHVSWIFFYPCMQGKGYGSKIARHCIKHLKTETIVVETSQYGSPLFTKLGFELKKKRKDYWAKGLDLYYMVLQI